MLRPAPALCAARSRSSCADARSLARSPTTRVSAAGAPISAANFAARALVDEHDAHGHGGPGVRADAGAVPRWAVSRAGAAGVVRTGVNGE
jgi:hypothetical protein